MDIDSGRSRCFPINADFCNPVGGSQADGLGPRKGTRISSDSTDVGAPLVVALSHLPDNRLNNTDGETGWLRGARRRVGTRPSPTRDR